MIKQQQLAILNKEMHKQCRCALKKTATNVVAGSGSADAQIFFVGEAPGKKEDAVGEPFIGAAGKMLSDLLLSINVQRDDVYITNVVKYRPPQNRDPLPQEIEACWPWLCQQVQLINPKLIVPLGRHALERFVPGQKISEAHGRVFHRAVEGLGMRTYYALYHPAAALYNGSLRETLFADIGRIPDILEELKTEKHSL